MATFTLSATISKFLKQLVDTPTPPVLLDGDKSAIRGLVDAASHTDTVSSLAGKQPLDADLTAYADAAPGGTEDQKKAARRTLIEAAPLVSPDFSGFPTATTPTPGDRSARLATTEFVADSGAKDVTYQELTVAIGAGSLIKGRWYRITDYASKYVRPYWTGTGTTWATEWAEGPVEPLLVMAFAANKVSTLAYSEAFPQDEITYDVSASSFSTTAGTQQRKGFIIRRTDTRLNISLPYDYRNMKWNRYLVDTTAFLPFNAATTYAVGELFTSAGNLYASTVAGTTTVNASRLILSNIATWYWVGRSAQNILPLQTTNALAVLKPTGTAVEFFTFSSTLSAAPTEGSASVMNFTQNGSSGETLNNVILASSCNTNTIGSAFHSNTIGASFSSNTLDSGFSTNTIGASFSSNTIGSGFFSNTIGASFSSNTIGSGFFSNTIGSFFQSNTIGSGFFSNTVISNFRHNLIRYPLTSTNFSASTHVYNDYNTTISENSAGALRLSYLVGDTLTYAAITD